MNLEKLKDISGELCMYGLDTDSADYIALEGGILVERNHYGKGELSCAAVAVWSFDRLYELMPKNLPEEFGVCPVVYLEFIDGEANEIGYVNPYGNVFHSESGETATEAIFNLMKWLLQQPKYKDVVLRIVAKFIDEHPIPNVSVPTIYVTHGDEEIK